MPKVTVTSSAQPVEVSQTVVFTAAVTGVGPFYYQWQRRNVNITGETGPTFTIYDVSESDQTNYSCYVSNNYGDSAVSNILTLQVTSMCYCVSYVSVDVKLMFSIGNLPVIAENPNSTHIILKDNFTTVPFTCEADGATSYYWEKQHGSIPLSAIGVNTSTLTLINVQLEDTGNYRCVGINGSGNTESEYATLTIEGIYVRTYVTTVVDIM